MSVYHTYIIKSLKTGKHYIGSSKDIQKRLTEHNHGKTDSTRNKGPWVLVHTESFSTRTEALIREKQIKSYKGGNAFKKLINNC